MKKNIFGVVSLLLMILFLISCKDKETSTANNKKVRVFAQITGGKTPEENKLFQEAISKATGLDIEWEMVYADYGNLQIQKLSAGEAYDLIYLNLDQLYKLSKQDILIDITSMIENSKIYQDNVPKNQLEQIKYNEKYYAGFNKLELFPLPSINKVMTDRVGINLDNLKTLDDYYQMLKAIKTDQENMGKKPFYPLFIFMEDIWDMQPWFSSVGLKRGVLFDASGKKYSPWITAEAKPVWEWITKLYQEGLLDPESFTGKTSDMRNKHWNGQIALASDWAAWVGLKNNNAKLAGTYPHEINIVGLPGVASPDGSYMLEEGAPSLWGIPITSKNPDGGFKVLEFLATIEGGMLLTAGIEGHDYNLVNGKIEYTEEGIKHSKDHGATMPINKNFDYLTLGEFNPGFVEALNLRDRFNIKSSIIELANGELDLDTYYDIMSKWMTDAFQGKVSIDDAMKNAENELRTKKMID